ncbi:fungal fruit body lectin [Grosmannia clavigera kw1407]|uniref:Fungal fruit body lectin n=1 Tax=Grosmannia clavigera (strain kw1407 / UAMH 11150) TaxID=655863 RepID=F0XAN1_GROCL|nr:fungal fruit body lectin [Grosmannia clavigera kw1407]EFX06021.1 fungal fruit body lectin [Grosmannia clavigera kw1407]
MAELTFNKPTEVEAPGYGIWVHHRLSAPDLTLIDFDFDVGSSVEPTFDGHKLIMKGSGTSGLLRFRSSNGEEVGIVVGVHNYKRWCHIVTDFGINETSHARRAKYYSDDAAFSGQLWAQAESFTTTSSKGRPVLIDYFVKEGNDMHATVKY